ncbi:MAG: hypothetical protein H7A42_00480 [Chlamydiales bacterium]|nr:hypothetical protein [Chlamydiales bacterium]
MSSVLPQSSEQKLNATQSSQATESKAGINWKSAASSAIRYSVDAFYAIGNVLFGTPWIVSVEDLTDQAEPVVSSPSDVRQSEIKNHLNMVVRSKKFSDLESVVNNCGISYQQVFSDFEDKYRQFMAPVKEKIQEKIDALPPNMQAGLKNALETIIRLNLSPQRVVTNLPDIKMYFHGANDEEIVSDLKFMMANFEKLNFDPAVSKAPVDDLSKKKIQEKIDALPLNMRTRLKETLETIICLNLNLGNAVEKMDGLKLYFKGASDEEIVSDLKFMMDNLNDLEFDPTERIQDMFDRMTSQDQVEFYLMINEIKKPGIPNYEAFISFHPGSDPKDFKDTEKELQEIIYDEYQGGTTLMQVRSDLLFILKNFERFDFEKGQIKVKETEPVTQQVKKTKKKKTVCFDEQVLVHPIKKENRGRRP